MKKIITALVAFTLLFITLSPLKAHAENPFTDINAHPYRDAIDYNYTHGIVVGYPDNTFHPNQMVNRSEFVKIVVQNKLGYDPKDSASRCFSDVQTLDWWASYACYLKGRLIIQGFENNTFRGSTTITFKEAAKILTVLYDIPVVEDPIYNEIWYHKFMFTLAEKQYVPQSIINANHYITRGELAEMVYRIKEGTSGLTPYRTFDALWEDTIGEDITLNYVGNDSTQFDARSGAFLVLHLINTQRSKIGLLPLNYNIELNNTGRLDASSIIGYNTKSLGNQYTIDRVSYDTSMAIIQDIKCEGTSCQEEFNEALFLINQKEMMNTKGKYYAAVNSRVYKKMGIYFSLSENDHKLHVAALFAK